MNAGARWDSLSLASSRHISTSLWLNLELKVIWETEVEDQNLLHTSILVSLLKSRNKLSCSNTAFSNASPYLTVNFKRTLKINLVILTHPHHKAFIPPKPTPSY